MQKILVQDEQHKLKIVLVHVEGTATKKWIIINARDEAIHLEVNEIFLLQRLVNETCRRLLRGDVTTSG